MVAALLDEWLAKETHNAETGTSQTSSALLQVPHLKPHKVDDTYPLTDYFIASSHNTYLVANQLWGSASPASYTTALNGNPPSRPPARCVEIDVWWSKAGPVVTHGHTFTGSIPFKAVCEAIGEAVTSEHTAPITVSLECHVDRENQPELVHIMKVVWGDKLVAEPVHKSLKDKLTGIFDHTKGKVAPEDIRGKIFLMIEWYPNKPVDEIKDEEEDDSSSSSSDSDFSESEEAQEFKKWKTDHPNHKTKIHPDLAALGVYANSIKPKGGWVTRDLLDPLHALINISESGLAKHLPDSLTHLIAHSSKHLRRCYPRGTRVQSTNMDPLPAWRTGTQVVALNFQVWDLGMKLNRALFEDSEGWVLKPEGLRGGHSPSGEKTFKVHIIGADDVPHPSNTKNLATYFKIYLFTPAEKHKHHSKVVQDHGGDPFWDETVEFKYQDGELIFVSVHMFQDRWGTDEEVASFTAQLDRLQHGIRYWPLIDGLGNASAGRLLVHLS